MTHVPDEIKLDVDFAESHPLAAQVVQGAEGRDPGGFPVCDDRAQWVALGFDQPGAASALQPSRTALNGGSLCAIGS
jgi:hypothetical protein